MSPSAAPCIRIKTVPGAVGSETLSPATCVSKPVCPGNSYSSCAELPLAPQNRWLLSQSRSMECDLLSVLVNASEIQLM